MSSQGKVGPPSLGYSRDLDYLACLAGIVAVLRQLDGEAYFGLVLVNQYVLYEGPKELSRCTGSLDRLYEEFRSFRQFPNFLPSNILRVSQDGEHAGRPRGVLVKSADQPALIFLRKYCLEDAFYNGMVQASGVHGRHRAPVVERVSVRAAPVCEFTVRCPLCN